MKSTATFCFISQAKFCAQPRMIYFLNSHTIKTTLISLDLFHLFTLLLFNWRTENSSKMQPEFQSAKSCTWWKGEELQGCNPSRHCEGIFTVCSPSISRVWGLEPQWHMIPHLFPELRIGWLCVCRVLLFPFDGTLLLNNKPKRFLKLLISPNCLHFQQDHFGIVLNEGIVQCNVLIISMFFTINQLLC